MLLESLEAFLAYENTYLREYVLIVLICESYEKWIACLLLQKLGLITDLWSHTSTQTVNDPVEGIVDRQIGWYDRIRTCGVVSSFGLVRSTMPGSVLALTTSKSPPRTRKMNWDG